MDVFHEVLPDKNWNYSAINRQKLVLQIVNTFMIKHTKELEHFDHNIGLSIKNKSGKQKLTSGNGWS